MKTGELSSDRQATVRDMGGISWSSVSPRRRDWLSPANGQRPTTR